MKIYRRDAEDADRRAGQRVHVAYFWSEFGRILRPQIGLRMTTFS
jgi:hypothetical protein